MNTISQRLPTISYLFSLCMGINVGLLIIIVQILYLISYALYMIYYGSGLRDKERTTISHTPQAHRCQRRCFLLHAYAILSQKSPLCVYVVVHTVQPSDPASERRSFKGLAGHEEICSVCLKPRGEAVLPCPASPPRGQEVSAPTASCCH